MGLGQFLRLSLYGDVLIRAERPMLCLLTCILLACEEPYSGLGLTSSLTVLLEFAGEKPADRYCHVQCSATLILSVISHVCGLWW